MKRHQVLPLSSNEGAWVGVACSNSGTERPALEAGFVWEEVTVPMKTLSRLVAIAKLENGP